MESMKRFVEERKKTIEDETAKLRVEHDAIIAYLNSVMEKADSDCCELLQESDCDRFRKKCVPLLNWLQEKYDTMLLMRSICLPTVSVEAPICYEVKSEIESCQSMNIPLDMTHIPVMAKDVDDGESVYESALSVSSDSTKQQFSVSTLSASSLNVVIPSAHVPNLFAEGLCSNTLGPTSDIHLNEVDSSICGSSDIHLNEVNNFLESEKMDRSIQKSTLKERLMKVMVTWIISPWLFWLQVKPQTLGLENLLEELTNYHTKLKRTDPDYRLYSKPRVGQLVSARFFQDDMWYRAYVVAVFELPGKTVSGGKKRFEVSVVYMDYGNSERLPLNRVRPLPERFMKLPLQAFPCSLSRIGPVDPVGEMIWSTEGIQENFTKKFDFSMILTARLIESLPGCPIMFVDILTPSQQDSSTSMPGRTLNSLAEILIQEGKAIYMPDNNHVAEWYKTKYSKVTELAKPCEKMVASLTQYDIHSFIKPQFVTELFETGLSICANVTELSVTVGKNQSYYSVSKNEELRSTSSVYLQRQGINHDIDGFLDSSASDSDKISREVAPHNLSKAVFQSWQEVVGASKSSSNGLSGQLTVLGKDFDAPHTSDIMSAAAGDANVGVCGFAVCDGSDDGNRLLVTKTRHNTASAKEFDVTANFGVSEKDLLVKIPVQRLKNSADYGNRELCDSKSKESMKYPVEITVKQKVSSEKGETSCLNSCTELPSSSKSLRNQKFLETKAYLENLAESGWPQRIAREAVLREDGYKMPAALECLEMFCVDGPNFRPTDAYALDDDIRNHDPEGHFVTEELMPAPVPRVVPERGIIRLLMSYIESPSRFWVHLINRNAEAFDCIRSEIRKSRMEEMCTEVDLINDDVLRDFCMCCALSNEDNELYRAVIIDSGQERISTNGNKCDMKFKVFYIDFGNSEWISVSRLRPLPRSLVDIPGLAVPCCLEGIVPDLNDESGTWSQEAISVFTQLSGFTKELIGYLPSDFKAKDVLCPSNDSPLKLRLEDQNADVPVDINKEMIKCGFAKSAFDDETQVENQLACIKATEDEPDEMTDWNPMAEDYLSCRNNYLVDVDDPGVATVNYKAQDEKRICRFFRHKNSSCWRGENCPFEHMAYEGVVTTTDRREVYSVCDSEHSIELPSVGSWVVLNVTYMVNPGRFFVVLPFGSKSCAQISFNRKPLHCSTPLLDEGYDDGTQSSLTNPEDSLEYLIESLQEFYKAKVYSDNDLTIYAEGEIVVARSTKDERWHRAKILISDPDYNRVQVFYVDYGHNEWVDIQRIRQMEVEFLCLPFQAVECCLPLVPKSNLAKIWPEEARSLFIDLTLGQFLIAHVLQRGPSGILYVDLYNTTDKNNDVNISEVLLQKGYAAKLDTVMVLRSPCHQTSSLSLDGNSRTPSESSSVMDLQSSESWNLSPG